MKSHLLAATVTLVSVLTATLAPGPVMLDVQLHDSGSVMQSFARTSPDGTWIFSQVMQEGRFGQSHAYHLEHGDLTLTHVSEDGSRVLSWMYLRNFGHGMSIGVQPAHPGLWIWTEARAVQGPTASDDGFGTRIARFKWQPGKTLWPSSSGVRLFNPNPSSFHVSPSLDVADGLIAARYMNADKQVSYAVYHLADFLAGRYVAIRRIPQIAAPGTGQGWSILPGGEAVGWLTGDHYSDTNPPPGDALLTVFDSSGIVSQTAIDDDPGLTWREPEGVFPLGGLLCYGLASGPARARVANIYCR